MPMFRVTVKSRVNTNGMRLEPGMSVDIVSNSFSDSVVKILIPTRKGEI